MERERAKISAGQLAAVTAGNALEFYDFVTYAFFASQIGRCLFPGAGPDSLLLSLATFGVGFLTRPLGGFIIGRYADRKGRRPAMVLSFTLMGVAMTGLALTPSYAAIGIAAPVIAVLFRLVQGFALGGEVGPNIAYLLETAPKGRRGLYISINFASADLAVLIAGLIGFGLSSTLSPEALDSWGWRAAMLIGVTIVPVGIRLRRTLAETLQPETESSGGEQAGPFAFLFTVGLLIIAGATVSNYTLEYLTTYAQTTLRMAVPTAFGATIVLGVIGVIGDLSGGMLADRFGAKRVLVLPWLLLIASILPVFSFLNATRTPAALLGSTAVLTLFHILGSAPAVLLFVQALPARVRAGATGTAYALAIAIFGGTTQLFETMLIRWTNNPVAPGFYMMLAVTVALIGALLVPNRLSRAD